MSPRVDYNEMVWCDYEGYIVKKTDKAIGLAKHPDTNKVEIWLPTSKLGRVTYVSGGDSSDLWTGKKIEAVELPRWLARDKKLIGSWE